MVYETPEGIQSYFRNLIGRFNLDAQGLPVIRVDDTVGGGHLRVRDFTLTIVPGPASAATRVEMDLTTRTLAQVASDVTEAGYQLSLLDAAYAPLSAAIIAEQDIPYPGRAYLSIATSMLWRILTPIALDGARLASEADSAAMQLDLRLASGRWLDRIADLYGTKRYENETDDALRGRVDYIAVRPRANATSLSAFVTNVLGLQNTVTDGMAHTFRTGQHASRTVARTSERVHRTATEAPYLTVTVHQTLPPDTPPYPLADEVGKRFWLRTGTPGSTTWNPNDVDGYSRTPPSVEGYYRPFASRELVELSPQKAGRALWHFIDENRAAGVRHLVILPRVIETSDTGHLDYVLQTQNAPHLQDSQPTTGFVQRVIINQLLPATPPTSLVTQGITTSLAVAGPIRVTSDVLTTTITRSRVALQRPTSLFVNLNHLTADATVWPIQRRVVRMSVGTSTIIRERVTKGAC